MPTSQEPNKAPVVVNEYVTVNSGQLVSAPASILLTNDSDPESEALTIVRFGTASHGTFTQAADGTISYVSAPGFSGQDTVTYVVEDAAGNQTTGTIYLNVVSTENKPPVLQDDYATVTAGSAVTADPRVLLGNDSDPNGDALIIKSFGKPTVGTLVQNADGTITYTAPVDYSGPAEFTYTVADGRGGETTATVRLTVAGAPNVAPEAVADQATTAHNTQVNINVLANDSDKNNDKLTVQSVGTPANGSATINPDGTVSYTPKTGFSGVDTFTYTVTDGKGGTDTASVTVKVAEAPNAIPDAADDTANAAHNTATIIDVLANDRDSNGDKLSVLTVGAPANGTATLNANGTVTYTPKAGFSGTDTFTYTVSDGKGGTDTAKVTLNVALPRADWTKPLDLFAADDSGKSNSDDWTNADRPKFFIGSIDASAIKEVKLYVDGKFFASSYDPATGLITPNASLSEAGRHIFHSFTYSVVNAAGGESARSPALVVNFDRLNTAPTTAPDMEYFSDWGAGFNGKGGEDNWTSDKRPTFQVPLPYDQRQGGGASAAYHDAELLVNGKPVPVTKVIENNGSTMDLRPLDDLPAGSVQISYRTIDQAGNVSSASPVLTVNIDYRVPPKPLFPDLIPETDTGISNADNLTKETRPKFYIGDAPNGELTPGLDIDGKWVAASWDQNAKTLSPVQPLGEGVHQVKTYWVYPSGAINHSDALTITVDALVDRPQTTPDLVAAYDSGVSTSDNWTNSERPVFNVGKVDSAAGEKVNLYVDGVLVKSTYNAATGEVTPDSSLVAAGSARVPKVQFSVINAAGAESPLSNDLLVTLDKFVANPKEAPDMEFWSDRGWGGTTDNWTSDTRPTFQVKLPTVGGQAGEPVRPWEFGQTAELLVNGSVVPSTFVKDNDYTYDLRPVNPLPGGVLQISYRLIDVAGNVSAASPALQVNIDTRVPPKPNQPDMTSATDLGVRDDDNITANTMPTFYVGPLPAGTKAGLDVDGQWTEARWDAAKQTLTPVKPLPEGVHAVKVFFEYESGAVNHSDALKIEIDAIPNASSTASADLGRRASVNLVAFEDSISSEASEPVLSLPAFMGAPVPNAVVAPAPEAVAFGLAEPVAATPSVQPESEALDLRDLLGSAASPLMLDLAAALQPAAPAVDDEAGVQTAGETEVAVLTEAALVSGNSHGLDLMTSWADQMTYQQQ